MGQIEREVGVAQLSVSNIERRLGGVELGLDALNRRSDNDTRDLRRRVVASQAAGL